MDPNVTNWLIYLGMGAIAGWLGGMFISGNNLGLIGNILAGIAGSVVGSKLFGGALSNLVGGGILGQILTAAVGAFIVIFVVNLIRRNMK